MLNKWLHHQWIITTIMIIIVANDCFGADPFPDWNKEGTLQLLQIVHTHGDRTPSHFVNDDPFIDQTRYWPEGVGQLTKKGRQQIYLIGRYLHENYKDFLEKHQKKTILEKVIEAQSSGTRRCLESTTILVQALIGEHSEANNPIRAFSVLKNSTADNSSKTEIYSNSYNVLSKFWRPIPVRSRHPKGSNEMLDSSIECPNLTDEIIGLKNFNPELRKLWRDNAEFIDDISHYCGEPLNDFDALYELLHELTFEQDRDLTWSSFKIWSADFEKKVIDRLFDITQNYLRIIYGNRKVQTLSVGLLLAELSGNLRHFLEDGTGPRVFVYGTHDSQISTLMDALDLYPEAEDERTINGGSAIAIELRQFQDQYFIRTFYIDDPFGTEKFDNLPLIYSPPEVLENSTLIQSSSVNRNYTLLERFSESFCFPELPINPKHLRCPIANFFEHVKPLEPFDWQYQCGLRTRIVNIFTANFAIITANFGCVIVLIFALKIYSSRIRLQG